MKRDETRNLESIISRSSHFKNRAILIGKPKFRARAILDRVGEDASVSVKVSSVTSVSRVKPV